MNRLKNKYVWIAITTALLIAAFGSKILPSFNSTDSDKTLTNNLSSVEIEPLKAEATTKGKYSISLEDCKKIYASNQTPEELLVQKRYLLTSLLRNLEREGVDQISIEIIGDVAGLTKNDIFSAASGLNQSEFLNSLDRTILLPDDYPDRPNLNGEQIRTLDKFLSDFDYEGLTQSLLQKAIAPNSIKFGDSILTHALKSNRNISYVQLQGLVNAGATIDLKTIVTAIQQNSETDKIKFLVENYHKPLDTVWSDNDIPMNLPLLAAKYLRPDLFTYFNNEKQINPHAASYAGFNNILDSLPEPKNATEEKIAISFIKGALKFGQTPIRYSTAQRINRYLPNDVKSQYAKQLSSWMKPTDEMIEKAAKIKDKISEQDKRIAKAELDVSSCNAQHNFSLETFLNELVRQKPKSSELSLATKKQLNKFVQKQLTNFYSNPLKYIKQAMAKDANIKYSPPPADLVEQRTKLTDLMNERKWDLALRQCEQFNDKEGYTMLLASYLWSEKPDVEFIHTLFSKGATLDPYAIITLSMKGNIDLIEKLSPYGLDFKYQNSQGANALSESVTNLNNSNIVEYLIEHGTPVKPETLGMDPLDLALEQLDTYSETLQVKNNVQLKNIALLLKAGAPIEQSHREKLVQLKTTNPYAYEELLKFIPNLESYFI